MKPNSHLPLMALLLAFLPAALPAQRPAGAVPRLEQLSRAQFDALPVDQVIEVRGKQRTKRELVAAIAQRTAEARSQSEAAARQREAAMQAEQAAFAQQETARLEQKRMRVRADAAPLAQTSEASSAVPEAVRTEARELRSRMERATTDAERQAIHLRAQQLLAQLQRP